MAKDTLCSHCNHGVNWEKAVYDEETGEVYCCANCKNKAQREKRQSKHKDRWQTAGKRPF